MSPKERLENILLSASLGPITPFCGIVNGVCQCGRKPSKAHKPGKHPLLTGWQEMATTDHETIIEWFDNAPGANFAVITGIQTVVLDLDVKPGKDGNAALAKLEADAGQQLSPTVTAFSGTPGARHLYYKVPRSAPSKNRREPPELTSGDPKKASSFRVHYISPATTTASCQTFHRLTSRPPNSRNGSLKPCENHPPGLRAPQWPRRTSMHSLMNY